MAEKKESSEFKELSEVIKEVFDLSELENLIKSFQAESDLKMIATDIIIDELSRNPRMPSKELCKRVYLRTWKQTEQVLKREVYNQIMDLFDKKSYRI